MAASGAMLRATNLSFLVLLISMLLIYQYAEAQNIKTVTGGGNPGNPTTTLTPPPPPFIPFFSHGGVPQGELTILSKHSLEAFFFMLWTSCLINYFYLCVKCFTSLLPRRHGQPSKLPVSNGKWGFNYLLGK